MTGIETSERFVLLETKIAFQEKLRELDLLTARVQRLESTAATQADAERLPYERPPHY
jgi:uncharacterized coiled-coil protein SlyX